MISPSERLVNLNQVSQLSPDIHYTLQPAVTIKTVLTGVSAPQTTKALLLFNLEGLRGPSSSLRGALHIPA